MTNASFIPKRLIILGIAIPIALILGYQLATPDAMNSLGMIGVILIILTLPIFLRWHHSILIFSWNAAMTIFFLPGQLGLWMMMSAISAFITVVGRPLNKEYRFQNVRSITWVMVFFIAVIIFTAKATGGIGLRSMGGNSFGGKRYFELLMAITGYFALSWHRIPVEKANNYVTAYFLSGVTPVISNVAYVLGPAFYFLFWFFPVAYAELQIMADMVYDPGATFKRFTGLAFAGMAVYFFLLARYGLRGLLDSKRPWRVIVLATCMALALLGGFRSVVVQFGIILIVQFFVEGLHRTRIFIHFIAFSILGLCLLIPLTSSLPLSVQRSLSFLPLVNVDASARIDAKASMDWRFEMWSLVMRDIPKYFWIGKGYSLNPTDMYLVEQSRIRGLAKSYETSLAAGDYHNGPLSLIIPLGIWGLLAYVGLLIVGLRMLVRNFRYGDPRLNTINTALLTFFIGRALWFMVFCGGISGDLAVFTGLLGFSVALNGPDPTKELRSTENESASSTDSTDQPRRLKSSRA